MAREIERRFLVHREKLPPLGAGRRFVQGYLSEKPHTRFRVEGNHVTLAVKEWVSAGERLEFEFPRGDMPTDEIERLMGLALWPPLVKTRHEVPRDGLTWEIDFYEGRNAGLVTAEVELPAIDHPIDFPDWVDRNAEITSDARYANISLTKQPYGEWDSEWR